MTTWKEEVKQEHTVETSGIRELQSRQRWGWCQQVFPVLIQNMQCRILLLSQESSSFLHLSHNSKGQSKMACLKTSRKEHDPRVFHWEQTSHLPPKLAMGTVTYCMSPFMPSGPSWGSCGTPLPHVQTTARPPFSYQQQSQLTSSNLSAHTWPSHIKMAFSIRWVKWWVLRVIL